MITFVRQATVASGKLGEGMAFAKEIAGLASRIGGSEVRVAAAVGGRVPTIGWISTYQDLGAYEVALGKLNASQDYIATIKKAHGLLVDGSITDQIWRHV